ncbi:hypothetical protein HMPREF9064_1659 [Aggregatibacter segnis ATCC 33393]|uniref:Uncharacterized protein n=1 Tax=Aggregatibacter segnis ATCC 33393 TaxID=888057 RepID=E6KZS7_9PAST|nr:hypothetical protein HMPREF9064_1659 [Aggregatibacter segnis ATCC 33393]
MDTVKNIKSHLKVRSFFNAFFGCFFVVRRIIAKQEKASNKMEAFWF